MKTLVLLVSMVMLLVVASAGNASAVGYPRMVNIQGRLADAGGNAVTDGSYDVTFSLYTVETGGTPIWTENVNVDVVNGLFSTMLGSVTVLPDSIFSGNPLLWLGMKVGTDPEMTPRQQFVAMPYSYVSYNTANSGAGWIDDNNTVRLSNVNDSVGIGTSTPSAKLDVVGNMKLTGDLSLGDSNHTGGLKIYHNGVTNQLCEFNSYAYGGFVRTYDENLNTINSFEPDVNGEGGFLSVYRSTGSIGFYVDGNSSGTNEPVVAILGSSQVVNFNLSQTGDASVVLPNNSVSPSEILGEAGISSQFTAGTIVLSTTAMTTVETVTITAPTDGYVFLIGRTSIHFSNPTGLKLAWLQIDTTSGGDVISGNFTLQRIESFPGAGTYIYSMVTQRAFFVNAGSHTFYLEGKTNDNGTAAAYVPQLTAMFFPTSYGVVESVANASDASQFEKAVALPMEEGSSEHFYKVDLRELEIKAKKLREELRRVEEEIAKAELQNQIETHAANR